jgi:hypothetical protein
MNSNRAIGRTRRVPANEQAGDDESSVDDDTIPINRFKFCFSTMVSSLRRVMLFALRLGHSNSGQWNKSSPDFGFCLR